MMQASLQLTLLLLLGTHDIVASVDPESRSEVIYVSVGDTPVLNCTYNCSSGFIRGYWTRDGLNNLHGSSLTVEKDLCTLSLSLPILSVNDTQYNYTCYTVDSEQMGLPRKMEGLVSLQPQAGLGVPEQMVTPPTQTKAPTDLTATITGNQVELEDHGAAVKVLATVTIVVAMVLAVLALLLCLTRSRNGKTGFTSIWTSSENSKVGRSTTTGPSSNAPCDRVALRITPPDDQSDHEVPYADIVIAVRGTSTPELTQVSYVNSGDYRETGLGPSPRSHLQACRSADRLHVHPREVSRKMSTSSEYAVITYS